MTTIENRMFAACSALALSSAALAGAPSGLLTYSQPWNEGLGAHPSARSCDGGFEIGLTSVSDDFVWPVDAQVSRVTWWGTNPTSPDVPNVYFYIEISPDPQDPNTGGECDVPAGEPVFSGCVRAAALYAGVDCEGRPVYRFDAVLGSPVPLTGGTRYYLVIAEADIGIAGVIPDSQNVGEADFAWSGHRQPRGISLGCIPISALPGPAGLTVGPTIDPCDGENVEMAFELHRNVVTRVLFPRALLDTLYRFELRELGTETVVAVQTAPLFADRSFHVSFDVPDGLYDLVVSGPDIRSTPFPSIDLTGGTVDLGAIQGNVIDASLSAWLYGNPWDRNRGAIVLRSNVLTCDPPWLTIDQELGDDFGAGPDDPAITRIEWWGINPSFDGMPERNFLIRAYEDVSCNPNQLPTHAAAPFYSACVEANAKVVGSDCNGDTVFRFNASLPMPIQPPSEQTIRLLKIAEIEVLSLHPYTPDFAWSPAITRIGCSARIETITSLPLPAVSQ